MVVNLLVKENSTLYTSIDKAGNQSLCRDTGKFPLVPRARSVAL
jgi:hypothetical protein